MSNRAARLPLVALRTHSARPLASPLPRATRASQVAAPTPTRTLQPLLRQLQNASSFTTSAHLGRDAAALRPTPSRLDQPRRTDTSVEWAKKGPISYRELKPLTEQPTGEITLIDVREPDEVASGNIPSSVNVPLSQFANAFDARRGSDFQREFGFPRPEFGAPLIFYCRSGKRSAQAQEIARQNGWKNSRNYEGSWLDWSAQEEARKSSS